MCHSAGFPRTRATYMLYCQMCMLIRYIIVSYLLLRIRGPNACDGWKNLIYFKISIRAACCLTMLVITRFFFFTFKISFFITQYLPILFKDIHDSVSCVCTSRTTTCACACVSRSQHAGNSLIAHWSDAARTITWLVLARAADSHMHTHMSLELSLV